MVTITRIRSRGQGGRVAATLLVLVMTAALLALTLAGPALAAWPPETSLMGCTAKVTSVDIVARTLSAEFQTGSIDPRFKQGDVLTWVVDDRTALHMNGGPFQGDCTLGDFRVGQMVVIAGQYDFRNPVPVFTAWYIVATGPPPQL